MKCRRLARAFFEANKPVLPTESYFIFEPTTFIKYALTRISMRRRRVIASRKRL